MFKREISRVAVVCLFSWLAFAQSQNGRILGTVTDPSGAVVVGAKVVITDYVWDSLEVERRTLGPRPGGPPERCRRGGQGGGHPHGRICGRQSGQ